MRLVDGARIRMMRESRGLTQDELAEKVNSSRITINRIECESGKNPPNAEIIVRLADYFQVSTDYIFGRTDIPEGMNYRFDGTSIYSAEKNMPPEEQVHIKRLAQHAIDKQSLLEAELLRNPALDQLVELVADRVIAKLDTHK